MPSLRVAVRGLLALMIVGTECALVLSSTFGWASPPNEALTVMTGLSGTVIGFYFVGEESNGK